MKTMITFACFFVCFILGSSYQYPATEDRCGKDPSVRRILSIGPEEFDHFHTRLDLLGVQKFRGASRILLQIDKITYSSDDRGLSWHIGKTTYYGKLTAANPPGVYVVSHADPKTVFRQAIGAQHKSDLEVSTNGGRSWELVHPRTTSGRHLAKVSIVETGTKNPQKIYAEISTVGERGIYVSDNYGKTFKPLLGWSPCVVESQANSNVLFALPYEDHEIKVSIDEGANWKALESSRVLFSPLFINNREFRNMGIGSQLRSWKESDQDLPLANEAMQIVTDPNNSSTFYILFSAGLYRSKDFGKTFRLLPLAENRSKAIRKVAVDPLDGRFLFAVVGGKELFRSSDDGCSWHKLKLPD
jgi:hypothetical protein